MNKIRSQYFCVEVVWDEHIKTLLESCRSQENNEVDTRPILVFVQSVCDHLADRFPENEVQDWSAFDFEAIAKCNFSFGVEQIRSLCSKYQDLLGYDEIDVI